MDNIRESVNKRYKNKFRDYLQIERLWHAGPISYSVEELLDLAESYSVFIPPEQREKFLEEIKNYDNTFFSKLSKESEVVYRKIEYLNMMLEEELDDEDNDLDIDNIKEQIKELERKEEDYFDDAKRLELAGIIKKYSDVDYCNFVCNIFGLGRFLYVFLGCLKYWVVYKDMFIRIPDLNSLGSEYVSELKKINTKNEVPEFINILKKESRIHADSPYINLEFSAIQQLIIKYFSKNCKELNKVLDVFYEELGKYVYYDDLDYIHQSKLDDAFFNNVSNRIKELDKRCPFNRWY